MKYSIVVLGAPYSSQSSLTALNFCKAVIESGHTLFRVFFYHDGVHAASSLSVLPRDEQDIPANWQAFQQEHQLDLVVCIAAAVKRGILNEGERNRHQKAGASLANEFSLSGLGQLVEATIVSDRVITFGN